MRTIRLPLDTTRGKGLPAIWEQGGRPKNTTDNNSPITAQVIAYQHGAPIKPVHWWTPRKDYSTGEIRKDAYYYSKQHALFVADTGLLVVQTSVTRRALDEHGSDAIQVRIYQITDITSKGTIEYPAWEAECSLLNTRSEGRWKQFLDPRHRKVVEAAMGKTQCVCRGPHYVHLSLDAMCANVRLDTLLQRSHYHSQRSGHSVRMEELVEGQTLRSHEVQAGDIDGEPAYKYI